MRPWTPLLLGLVAAAPGWSQEGREGPARVVTVESYYSTQEGLRREQPASFFVDPDRPIPLTPATQEVLERTIVTMSAEESRPLPESLTVQISGHKTTFSPSTLDLEGVTEDRLPAWATVGAGLAIVLAAPKLALAAAPAIFLVGAVNPLLETVEWANEQQEEQARFPDAGLSLVGPGGRRTPVELRGGPSYVFSTLTMPGRPRYLEAYLAGSVVGVATGMRFENAFVGGVVGAFAGSISERIARGATRRHSGRRVSLGELQLESVLPSLPSVTQQPGPEPSPVTIPIARAIQMVHTSGAHTARVPLVPAPPVRARAVPVQPRFVAPAVQVLERLEQQGVEQVQVTQQPTTNVINVTPIPPPVHQIKPLDIPRDITEISITGLGGG